MSARGLIALLTAAAVVVAAVESARILAVFPFPGFSHTTNAKPIISALVERGHHVTLLGQFNLDKPSSNFRLMSLNNTSPVVNGPTGDFRGVFKAPEMANRGFSGNLKLVLDVNAKACTDIFAHPNTQKLIQSRDEHFDLLFTEVFGSDCALGFAHKFRTPIVGLSTHMLMPWAIDRMAVPADPHYVPTLYSSTTDKMNFVERLMVTMHHAISLVAYEYHERAMETLARQHFGDDMPPLGELARNTSLILVNTHFSVFSARPSVPGIVDIGGINLRKPKVLPKDLANYLDGSSNGVVYFSMGSILKGSSFPNETVRSLLTAFSRLKENVLWKWDGEAPAAAVPPNVRLEPWVPQPDILKHPNVRVFISHGGLGGTTEAVDAGVPIIVVPMFGDQPMNAAMLRNRGMSLTLHYDDLVDSEKVYRTVRRVLDEPSFKENARRVSAAFRDRPMSALDTAVYWVEFVLRHDGGGAPFLRTQAVGMSWFRRANGDVLLALLLLTALLAAAFVLAVRAACRCCRGSRGSAAAAYPQRAKKD